MPTGRDEVEVKVTGGNVEVLMDRLLFQVSMILRFEASQIVKLVARKRRGERA